MITRRKSKESDLTKLFEFYENADEQLKDGLQSLNRLIAFLPFKIDSINVVPLPHIGSNTISFFFVSRRMNKLGYCGMYFAVYV